jgi:hypothetical protein
MRPQKRIWRFQWDRRSGFRGFNETKKRIRGFHWDRWSGFHSFNETTESFKKTSKNIIFPQKGSFQHKTLSKKFGFWGLNETARADSAVSMTAWKWIQRFQWNHGCRFDGLNENAKAASSVSMRLRNLLTLKKPLRKRLLALNPF